MKKSKLQSLTASALIAAVLCAVSPIAIPIGDVPLSLATLVILIAAGISGSAGTAAAVAVYLILGCIGIPVFSGFTGGVWRVLGPTGGFLIGYIPLALISGIRTQNSGSRSRVILMIAGTLTLYLIGTLHYCFFADVPPSAAISACVLPFLPLDAIKIITAEVTVKKINNAGEPLF